VLQERLKTLQAAGTLSDTADALARDMKPEAGAAPWYRLARYRETARQWAAATAAIRRSLDLPEPDRAARLLAWRAGARIHEGGGNLREAVQAHRRLAQLDRRTQVDHLTQVVRLETKLGRREQALEAGRKLLEASPGNLEAHRFYADLCFQVGERTEGLEVLRRAVHANPNDNGALTALAEQFHTDEAIQLYWRAHDRKDTTLANRLDVIDPLTELYLVDNRFDKLLERLRRGGRDAAGRREAALCVAEAYKAAGDLGTARQELESLLAETPGELGILRQLASLAEREGDLPAAARYQRQVLKLTPSDRAGSERLALLLARSGEVEDAAVLWQDQAGKEKKTERLLPLIDLLFVFQQYDRALEVTRRLLREQPRNWEALYREGVALARLDRPREAQASFRAILDLRDDDDQLGSAHAIGPGQKPATGLAADFAIQDRVNVAPQVAAEASTAGSGAGEQKFWSPADAGQARMAALDWLLTLAQRDDRQDEFLRERRAARDPAHKDLRGWWDWYYLQRVRGDLKEAYQAARVLHEKGDLPAQWVFLHALNDRDGYKLRPGNHGQPAVQKPLPKAEVDAALESYRLLGRQQPGWITPAVFTNVSAELRGAGRVAEADEVYRQATDDPRDLAWTFDLLEMAARRGDVAETFKLFEQVARLQGVGQKPMPGRNFPPLVEASVAFAHLMQVRSDQKALPDVLRVLDDYLSFRRRRAQVEKAIPLSAKPGPYYPAFRMMLGNNPAALPVPFPLERNRYYDQGGIRVLRKALDLYTKADLLSDLLTQFHKQADAAQLPFDKTYAQLTLAYLYWWQEEFEPALQHLNQACEAAPDDAQLQLQLAEAYEKLGRLRDALARIDAVVAPDHVILQRREAAALRVAAPVGN
jgi:tetratricopeptide (TPR) repeat protein